MSPRHYAAAPTVPRTPVPLAAILAEYFPGESPAFHDTVLWTYTGYPCYWSGAPESDLRMQLAVVADKLSRCETLRDCAERYEYLYGRLPWEGM